MYKSEIMCDLLNERQVNTVPQFDELFLFVVKLIVVISIFVTQLVNLFNKAANESNFNATIFY